MRVASRRAARRFYSPAFAANALHFGSDLAGSVAVLIGLIFVAAGEPSADAAAALFVACLVVAAALRLARQSIDVLMDHTEVEAEQRIRSALASSPTPWSCAASACAARRAATSPTLSWPCPPTPA